MNATEFWKITSVGALLLVAGAVTLLSGCGKRSETPKVETVEGKVSSVDTKSGVVKMRWFSPKQKQEMELSGTLAPEAEIFINGRTAGLDEVRIDDNVRVIGYVEKLDGERRMVASKVEITRPEPISTGETSPPATAPSQ